jgi:hypothetical protein
LGLSDEAKAVIMQIRASSPARHVQSATGNVSGTYPSIKMGCSIQFEVIGMNSPFVYLIEHEDHVLDQRHIGCYLAQPTILRDPKVRELPREVCRKLETNGGGKSQ